MRFCSFAFGCRVNEAEKEKIDKELIEKGFVYDKKNPQFYIINTCAVTQKAERECRNLIYQIKKKLPQTKIIITGCVATYWQKTNIINNLKKDLPIDLLINNQNKEKLIKIIQKSLSHQANSDLVGQNWLVRKSQKLAVFSKFLSSGRLLVKIQDGCQRFCSYCIVPYLRGLPKSIKINDIVDYINQNQSQVSEIILTAINTEAFGYDTKETFIDLIKNIIQKTTIPRISFGSIHPLSINLQFLNFYQKILTTNRLVNFFHIPIQSGSNTILNLMKRGYQKEEIMEKLNSLYKINPFSFLATDIIVGFLGETEKEFEKTYQFLEKSPLSRFHIFRFSKRKNTAAFYMTKNIKEPEEKTKKIRSQILRKLSQKKYQLFLEKNLNRITTTLILNKKTDDFWEGLLDNQLPILIRKEKLSPGKIVNVKIEEIKNNFLIGKIKF
ncbi:MAG: MiaB/RimO family radical SAM methylthiotransferase [Patescibacteria group bacterium]|nr:MiaB/RimO family radical SAM methylthiotransferase [Patescibacteria group bacterium]